MKNRILTLFLFLLMASPVLSQVKPQAYVLIPFDTSVENEDDFRKKLSNFIKTISINPELKVFKKK